MVRRDLFSAELVRVEHIEHISDAFPEHKCPEGKVYVEVEPKVEYFIRLTSSADEPVYADITVDGQKIETGKRLPPNTAVKVGKYKRLDSDYGVEKSFIFEPCERSRNQPGNQTGCQASLLWTGEVKIEFFGILSSR